MYAVIFLREISIVRYPRRLVSGQLYQLLVDEALDHIDNLELIEGRKATDETLGAQRNR